MIRLIACDIDGTLLHGQETALSPEVLDQFRRLMDKGLQLCPASGRQYESLRTLFGPLSREMYCICENGAVTFGPGGVMLDKVPLDQDKAQALCRDILAAERLELMASGENMSYLCPKDPAFVGHMENFVKNTVTVVADPRDIPEPIIKVACYCTAGADYAAGRLFPRWAREFSAVISGAYWVDLTLADKGTGLRQLRERLGIAPEEVMAFGDQFNDLPMLEQAGVPYIMDNAPEALRRRFPRHCRRVEDVLRTL